MAVFLRMRSRPLRLAALSGGFLAALVSQAPAQMAETGPPAVGVIVAAKQPVTQSEEFIGRIEAVNRVNLVARVTAQLQKQQFVEGTEVKAGDVLYELERPPFEANLQSAQASVAQFQALLLDATLTTQRAQTLLSSPVGQKSTVDDALAQQQSLSAQLLGAQAQVKTAEINLGYTTITAPIDGKIDRTAVTVGNIVGPTSGALTTIVSQDPMYVNFPVSSRQFSELGERYAGKGGFNAVVIRLRLPDGSIYSETGKLDFVDPTIAADTDTIALRGSIPNPLLKGAKPGDLNERQLVDGEFVGVLLEGVDPVVALGIPRSAVLSDQQGDYVYVVKPDNTIEQRRIQLAQSTPSVAQVSVGLAEGEKVVVDGIQRVRPGIQVLPEPADAVVASSRGSGTSR